MLFRLFGKKKKEKPKPYSQQMEQMKNQKLEKRIQKNSSNLKEIFQNDSDFSFREFQLFGNTSAVAFFISSLVDKEKINRDIIKPLQKEEKSKKESSKSPSTSSILNEVLYYCDGEMGSDMKAVIDALLHGKTVIFIDCEKEALFLDTFKPEKRGISQPETERVVRGPRDGFIEQMQTNISLLRYRLPVPEFRVDPMEVGKKTKTKVSVCYLDNIASQELIDEVKKRIQDIEIDRILDAGYIEQFIQDNPRSPFPQVQNTERPDKAVGNVLEGRVAILVDGSPFALIVPAIFNQFYQTSEDYIERYMITSIIRVVRFMALIFSLTFSSLYITVLSFHPEMIPAQFVVAASSGRSGVPFPVVIEVLLMEVAMEILREATVRMPQQVGGALSIVGVLVIGEAAVSAGFVSPITVVIIALSTIGSFATPSYNAAIAFRLLKYPLIILSGFIGLLGLATGLMFIINHMISLRSFGVPYFTPVSPWNKQGFKDALIRAPLRWLTERPAELHPKDSVRVESGVKEGPTNPLADEKRGDSNE
ncbi:spore germination protein [Salinibacillus xinjiangensis]|uniref:Spore germination protein n=1 Tax=Salinibacillus xinjiangensis TaxID=1229268 RepID=A0A6G1X1E4_9BACI|nr:spore germination protein [Salinibacillus xinjiangensis]MRG84706.1 spore germination protein [Salinibacillus xinjiangensis]